MTEGALVFSLIASSWFPVTGPIQALSYGVPIIIFVLALAQRKYRITVENSFFVVATLCAVFLGFAIQSSDFHPLNATLAFLTYSSVLICLLRWKEPERLYERVIHWVALISIIEALFAIVQIIFHTGSFVFIHSGAGDHAVGTLMTHSHLFAIKMWFQFFLLLVAFLFRMRSKFIFIGMVSALTGAVAGSALMISVLFGFSILIMFYFLPSNLYYGIPRPKLFQARVLGILSILIVGTLFATTQKGNVDYIQQVFRETRESLRGEREFWRGKPRITKQNVGLLSENFDLFLLGSGLGHYSSRAAMILGGNYLRNHPSWIPIQASKLTEDYIHPIWNRERWTKDNLDGVLNQPFFSIQSLVMELGLITTLLVSLTMLYAFYRLILSQSQNSTQAALKFSALGALIMLPILCFSDNWLEFPSFSVPIWIVLSLSLSQMRQNVLREKTV